MLECDHLGAAKRSENRIYRIRESTGQKEDCHLKRSWSASWATTSAWTPESWQELNGSGNDGEKTSPVDRRSDKNPDLLCRFLGSWDVSGPWDAGNNGLPGIGYTIVAAIPVWLIWTPCGLPAGTRTIGPQFSGFYKQLSASTLNCRRPVKLWNWKTERRFVVVREELQTKKAAVGRKLIFCSSVTPQRSFLA
jgi:hypothetical protein